MFQSTPANFTAGDADISTNHCDSDHGFQSTPANFTAGDAEDSSAVRSGASFNPRPPISQRATTTATPRPRPPRRFNPRPPISQRATSPAGRCRSRSSSFQSTPANFTAGDTGRERHNSSAIHVSIHARQFHSGRRRPGRRRCSGRCGFNPRPPISQRATVGSLLVLLHLLCFNPRPPISQRATDAGAHL